MIELTPHTFVRAIQRLRTIASIRTEGITFEPSTFAEIGDMPRGTDGGTLLLGFGPAADGHYLFTELDCSSEKTSKLDILSVSGCFLWNTLVESVRHFLPEQKADDFVSDCSIREALYRILFPALHDEKATEQEIERLLSGTKDDRLEFMDRYCPDTIRVCRQCGVFMTEGYLFDESETLCSEKCARAYYEENGWDPDELDDDLEHADTDDSIIYYTSWYE